MKCALYARCASHLQAEQAIVEQIGKCKEFADRQGWVVLSEHIRFDEAASGPSTANMQALRSLLFIAKANPRPFDVILVTDLFRVSRDVVERWQAVDSLRRNGIEIIAVGEPIDSSKETPAVLRRMTATASKGACPSIEIKKRYPYMFQMLASGPGLTQTAKHFNREMVERTRRQPWSSSIVGVLKKILPAFRKANDNGDQS
jgi:Resolvase, N terminal domain